MASFLLHKFGTLKREKKIAISLLIVLLINLSAGFILPQKANAATLTEASIMLYRMGAGIANSSTNPILVVIKIPSGAAATEDEIRITVPDATSNAFTVDTTAANHTATTTGLPATFQGETLNAIPSLSSPASSATDNGANTSVEFTIGNITDTNLYGFLWTGGITNPSTGNAGTFEILIETLASNVAVDTQTVAVDTVTTNSDQVTVTATVPATFNFNVQDTALALGTLSTSAVSNNAMSSPIDIDTNASNGWVAWIRSEGGTDTLASATSGDSISSTDTGSLVTCSSGTECYTVDVAATQGGSSTGSLTVATEYDGNGTTQGGVIDTNYEQIAQSTGQAANDNLTLTVIAAISPVTEAATDYTDTWQIVGAGNF